MNREINFNAWIPELGYMLEDVAVGHGNIGFPSDDEDFETALKAKGFDPEEYNLPDWLYDTGEDWYQITESECFVLLQFTGLKDKNGNCVNEGHIVKKTSWYFGTNSKKPIESIGLVKWHDKSASFLFFVGYYLGLIADNIELEVIGNIYQNPDLLK